MFRIEANSVVLTNNVRPERSSGKADEFPHEFPLLALRANVGNLSRDNSYVVITSLNETHFKAFKA